MAIKDILLPLIGEPSAVALCAIDKCIAVAAGLGARIIAVAVEEEIPVRPKVVISADIENAEAIAAERSVSDARGLLKAFGASASRLAVRNEQRLTRLALAEVPSSFVIPARVVDLAIFPVKPHDSRSENIVERLIFDSGRPILICPEEIAADLPVAFDRVAIAWDHTAPAARAIADALPLLREAADVRIITATDERSQAELESAAALAAHLAEHEITATFEAIKIDGSSVGKVFEAYVKKNAIDLLVMGAFRHSRLNQLVWGGATKTVIGQPPCWVMMSR
ncbi:MAG TPA: universal stress protein [Bradyrhizobium sp.]|jgi:nucleotide-binding universal stress UspA family protein|nr:universal stress protein [Bradyrhizobium sp.]